MRKTAFLIDRLRFGELFEAARAGKKIALSGNATLVPQLFEQLKYVKDDLFLSFQSGRNTDSDTARAVIVETVIISLVTPEDAMGYGMAGLLVFTSDIIRMVNNGTPVKYLWRKVD